MSLLLAGADPASAATAPPANAPPAAAAPKAKAPAMTCWDERPTGSHVTKRICATPEELEKAQRDAQEGLAHRNHGARNALSPS
jgi:hypothetical protein